MKNKNKAKVKISPLYKLYMEMKEVMMTESEAMKQNITPLVWEEIKNKILTKKIINWAIRGEVATGKSTIAMKFMYEANKFLIKRKMYLQEENRKIKVPEKIDYMTHIMSDQTEFLRHANSGTWSVAIVIDEYNRLAEGGINATSEATLYDFYSDVFAQKFNHRFSCAPSIINDRNANIIIDSGLTITESQISDLSHTVDTDTNESTRVDDLYNDLGTANVNITFALQGVASAAANDTDTNTRWLINEDFVNNSNTLELRESLNLSSINLTKIYNTIDKSHYLSFASNGMFWFLNNKEAISFIETGTDVMFNYGKEAIDYIFRTDNQDAALVINGTNDIINVNVNIDMEGNAINDVSTIDTGQGANELYDMDQNVLTTSEVTFKNVTTSDKIIFSLGDNACIFVNGTDLVIANNLTGVTC